MFSPAPSERLVKDAERLAADLLPLKPPDGISGYLFGAKVHACAEAERMASADFGSLVSMDP
jgi:hypothetical protein